MAVSQTIILTCCPPAFKIDQTLSLLVIPKPREISFCIIFITNLEIKLRHALRCFFSGIHLREYFYGKPAMVSGRILPWNCWKKGYTIFGCNRRQLNIDYPSFLPFTMDITNEESVKKGLEEVSKVVSSLRAVLNVSCVMFMGSLIEDGEGILNQILDRNG